MLKTGYYNLEEEEYLKQNYISLGPSYCSNYLNRSYDNVQNKAKRLGLTNNIQCIKNGHLHRVRKPENLNINPNGFINIDSIFHAYLLGFIWGDGSLENNHNIVNIEITELDGIQLQYIFDKTGKWTLTKCPGRCINCKPSYRFRTSNKTLYNFLLDLGYKEKSYISHKKILEYIPKQLQYMWLRGLIDADGCFCKAKYGGYFNITSSYEQDWLYLIDYCNNINIDLKLQKQINKTSKNSSIKCTDFSNLLNLGNFIYPNLWDGVGLQRKFTTWIKIIQSYKQKPIPLNIQLL